MDHHIQIYIFTALTFQVLPFHHHPWSLGWAAVSSCSSSQRLNQSPHFAGLLAAPASFSYPPLKITTSGREDEKIRQMRDTMTARSTPQCFESISSSFVVLVLWAFGLSLDLDSDRVQSGELQLMHMTCFELLCISGLEKTVCTLFAWHWHETRLHSLQRIFTLSELFRASSGLCLYSDSTYSGFSLDFNLYELVWTRTLTTHMHLPLVEQNRSPIPNLCQKSGARSQLYVEPFNLQELQINSGHALQAT